MNQVQKAIEKFHNPYSCAQAVYAAFEDADDKTLEMLKANSGGRSPDGTCGALFAALLLAPQESRAELVKKFAQEVGDTKCRTIKTVAKTPCVDCVKAAAQLLKSAANK